MVLAIGQGHSKQRSSSWPTSRPEGSPRVTLCRGQGRQDGRGIKLIASGTEGRSKVVGGWGRQHTGSPQMKTSLPLFLHSHSSAPKADSSPKISRGLGGLKSEFLKQSAARGLRTQDQPAGNKGMKVAAEGIMCVCVHACGKMGRGSAPWIGLCAKGSCVCVCVHACGCVPVRVCGLPVSRLEGPGT